MMYQEKMAVAIKHGGKVLREFKDTVYIPFGSEYSFLIKNLHTRRAVVHIEIDGKDVTNGGLVVNANSSVDLERYITDNLNQGTKFKFIERTAKIEEHRGVGVEDGLVRIEFEYESEKREYPKTPVYPIDWKWNTPIAGDGVDAISDKWLNNTTYDSTSIQEDYYFSCTASGRTSLVDTLSGLTLSTDVAFASAANSPQTFINQVKNDTGITVPGSISEQKFINTYVQTDGVKHVMVFKLLGETENGKVEAPVTVKDRKIFHVDVPSNLTNEQVQKYMDEVKQKIREASLRNAKCTSCGHENLTTAKFCTECGTGLIIK